MDKNTWSYIARQAWYVCYYRGPPFAGQDFYKRLVASYEDAVIHAANNLIERNGQQKAPAAGRG